MAKRFDIPIGDGWESALVAAIRAVKTGDTIVTKSPAVAAAARRAIITMRDASPKITIELADD